MVLTSFAEVISIGSVIPFLGVLTSPERIFSHQAVQPFNQALGLNEPVQLLLPLTVIFGLAILMAGVMRLVLVWASTRLSFAVGADLSISIYRRTLYQPYSVHCSRNSSEVISGISSKVNSVIGSIIVPTLMLITSSVMLISILIALLAIEPTLALAAFGGFGVIYLLIIYLTRKQLLLDSQLIARESTNVIRSLQEGLGGIRDILLDGSQEAYCQIYRRADLRLRRAQGNNSFVSASPRYAMEALGMVLIAILAFLLSQQSDGIRNTIPILGALALGAQRLLPALQQAYAAWSHIRGGQTSLQDTLEFLSQPLPNHANSSPAAPITFEHAINLKQLGFRYNEKTNYVLRQVNISIPKGSRFGFIGLTGSGKSTLLDIIMGLLEPTEGSLDIDGQVVTASNSRAWQEHIAHVPQAIFLSDNTIEANIAFGVPHDRIDRVRVRWAAQQAQIADSIEMWVLGYQTVVGERGIRLSGGQRQRIGIARALYKGANVIIFDEATSALDNQTEEAVMKAIECLSQDLTMLIIAHRLTTLQKCTQIVELGQFGIKRIGTYEEIVANAH
jgi:ABC-type bacteriocin/lantibiotic exporter with double-glycine peptidase domain